jgi:hypothetical protein
MVKVRIFSDRQHDTLSQICASSLRLSTKENLYIYEDHHFFEGLYPPFVWEQIENIEWLGLLIAFTGVKNLYLSKEIFATYRACSARAHREKNNGSVARSKNVLMEGFQSESVPEGIVQFIFARQLTNQPVAISAWHRKSSRKRS